MTPRKMKDTEREAEKIVEIEAANVEQVRSQINSYLYSYLCSSFSIINNFYWQTLLHYRPIYEKKSIPKKHKLRIM